MINHLFVGNFDTHIPMALLRIQEKPGTESTELGMSKLWRI